MSVTNDCPYNFGECMSPNRPWRMVCCCEHAITSFCEYRPLPKVEVIEENEND